MDRASLDHRDWATIATVLVVSFKELATLTGARNFVNLLTRRPMHMPCLFIKHNLINMILLGYSALELGHLALSKPQLGYWF